MTGPITVTWDWKFVSTNKIPADYDINNNIHAELPGFDTGFTFSDYANRGYGNPNWVYNELATPFRLSNVQDTRYNSQGTCGGGGNWNDYGPEFKDGKTLHMTLIAHMANATERSINEHLRWFRPAGRRNEWQTAFATGAEVIGSTRAHFCTT